MTKHGTINKKAAGRREFLASTAGGLGFLLGFTFDAGGRAAQAAGTDTTVNAYIRIGTDESVTLLFGGCEMGQGAMTGLAQIIAEDLKVDWASVKVEQALASSISYTTGGSSAVRGRYTTLRKAGATAREMLISAAAAKWGVAPADCYAESGKVYRTGTSQFFTYGTLAIDAPAQPVPSNPPLVDPSAFKIVGQPIPRVDIPLKVNGRAGFGIDVRLDNMVYAVVKHCPTIGGTLASMPAKPSGAIAVIPLEAQDSRGAVAAGTVNAVAVVATNTWKAWQMAKSLSVKWSLPSNASSMDSTNIKTLADSLMATGSAVTAENVGDVNSGFLASQQIREATYSFPYLAHATMEPMNCTASVTPTSCEVWAPSQTANGVLNTAKLRTGLTADKITIHTTFLGGGLGRKIEQDYVSQAIQVSKALGRPVKLFWPREEDFAHDMYRPMALVKLKGGVDSAGNVAAFSARIITPSIRGQRTVLAPGVNDSSCTEGTVGLRYAFGNRHSEWVPHTSPIPVGYWRSVGHSFNIYATECMIDELAEAATLDPIVFRQQLLAGDPRAKAVVDAAAAASGWRNSLSSGHAWGVAFGECFNTLVCQVVDISAPTTTSIRVHRVTVAVDCGYAVNPNQVEAQMQGGIVHGLSAAMWGQVPFVAGVSQTRNFSKYRMLKLREMPEVQVVIVNSGTPTGGIGEPGVPPIAPAVANAYYRLTKTRLRTLPFFPSASTMGD